MGTLLDTTVFIDLERAVRRLAPANAMAAVSAQLEDQVGVDEEVGIAAITASELLHVVHRATPEHRICREAFGPRHPDHFPHQLTAGRTVCRCRCRISRAAPGSCPGVARARTVAGYAIPGIIVFFFWVVVIILVIILLAFIVHWAGGGVLNLRLGHFILNVGFT